MTDASDGKRDFFVSFNKADRAWATWIAWVLEEKGYSVFFQDWDFKGNFVLEMDRAHKLSRRTIAVLSPDYLTSHFTAPEWAARFAEDATSEHDLLVPVLVRPCELKGLLAQINYVPLVDATRSEAKDRLIKRVRGIRPKPDEEPFFPGEPLPRTERAVAEEPLFPPTHSKLAVHNLPPANPDFVGREQVLVELRRLLTSAPGPAVLTQAITGLGGIGKTQTALAYCYRHLADYELVWWLHAEAAATLATDYAALAGPLGLDPATTDQEKLSVAICERLKSVPSWLLVFDNVEDPALPRAWLPTTSNGHALVTSRRTDWRTFARSLPLQLMPEPEALQLLTGRPDPEALPADELAEAKALASELGYLPLALAQARAYMAETGRSLAGYRKLFQASRPAVLAKGRASPDYPASVARTWQISIEAASGACAAARPLLELLAFFSADPLPMAVLDAEPEALPEELRGELERDEATAALHRFSLIRAEAGSIAVHRLVHAVTRDGLTEARAQTCAEAAVRLVNAALPGPPQEHTNWPAFGTLLPHALATAEAAAQLGAGLEAAARVFNDTALYHHSRAAWGEAEPLCERATAIYEKTLGPEHPLVATSLNNLALLYQATGRYATAEPLYQRAIAIDEKAYGPDHPEVATDLNNLALLYRNTSRSAAAEPLYERALAIREKTLGPEHPDVAQSLNNLAGLYRATGRYAEAEPLLKRAIAIGEKTLGPEHPHLASRLNNLASVYQATGRYAEAEPLFKRAVAIFEKALGPEHPEVATGLNNLALLYRNTSRSAAAEPLFKRAIVILEKALPPDHPHLMQGRENYAGLLDQLERHNEAAALRAQTQAGRGGSPTGHQHGPGSET